MPACRETSNGVITQRVRAHVCVMQHRRPATAVGCAHNSPIANGTIIEEWFSPLQVTLYITRVGSFTSPGIDIRHQVEGSYDF